MLFRSVDIDDDIFVAWNGERAVLSVINYNKPYKDDWADEVSIDSAMAVVDSTAAVVDSAYAEEPEKPFDYKEEIKYLKEDIQSLKENIKENNSEIAKIQKDIKYLEKHHEYPKEKKGATDTQYSENEAEAVAPPEKEEDMENEDYAVDSDRSEERRVGKECPV